MDAIDDEEIRAVDQFLRMRKRLEGGPPNWVESERPNDMVATWNIVDDLDIVRANLRFRLSRRAPDYPSVSVIFRQHSVWRVDLISQQYPKNNPPWAAALGLPASFSGSHCHSWDDNRAYVARAGWSGGLPARRPVEAALRRVRQMLPWLADRIGIDLTPDQRGFDSPPRSQLFEE